jgi:ribosomal protein S18 acetylase RimI-like enzyme
METNRHPLESRRVTGSATLAEPGAGVIVREMSLAQVEQGIAPVVLAFAADPVARWFYPDARQYWVYAPQLVLALAGRAFVHGTAFGVEGYGASALWLPPGISFDEAAIEALVEESIEPSDLERKLPFLEQQLAIHPQEPHWYLPMIGVDPAQQGRGYGTALLNHALALVDRDGAPAYLEATSPRNRALYERAGFEAIDVIQAGDSPPMWAMWRRPRS